MKKIVFLSIIIAALLKPASAHGQDARETARLLGEIRDRARAYQEDANARRAQLSRKIDLLRALSEVADSVTPFGAGFGTDRARRKLEDAERILRTEPPLSEPAPGVVEQLRLQLQNPPLGVAPPQFRQALFATISRLEEHIIDQVEILQAEAAQLTALEGGLHQLQSSLRSAASAGLKSSIELRRLVAK